MTPEEFFADQMRQPLIWGATECAHTGDRWLLARGLPSAIAGSRYDFADEVEAEALLTRLPLPIMVARVMRRAGYRMTRAPKTGDIAVLAFPDDAGGTKVVCAVKGSRLWLFRSDKGIGAAGPFARVLGAWSVP